MWAKLKRKLNFVKQLDVQIGNTAVARLMRAETSDELVGKTDFDYFPTDLTEKSIRNIRRKSRKQYWSGLKTVSDLQTGLRAALAGLRKQI